MDDAVGVTFLKPRVTSKGQPFDRNPGKKSTTKPLLAGCLLFYKHHDKRIKSHFLPETLLFYSNRAFQNFP